MAQRRDGVAARPNIRHGCNGRHWDRWGRWSSHCSCRAAGSCCRFEQHHGFRCGSISHFAMSLATVDGIGLDASTYGCSKIPRRNLLISMFSRHGRWSAQKPSLPVPPVWDKWKWWNWETRHLCRHWWTARRHLPTWDKPCLHIVHIRDGFIVGDTRTAKLKFVTQDVLERMLLLAWARTSP